MEQEYNKALQLATNLDLPQNKKFLELKRSAAYAQLPPEALDCLQNHNKDTVK